MKMKKMVAFFVVLVAPMLTPAFGQETKIKLNMVHSLSFEGQTNYTFQGKDPDLDRLSVSIARTEAASGDWSCWVTPDIVPWSDVTVQIASRLTNYRFDDFAGMKNLHVATVTLWGGKSSDPYFERVVLDTIPVIMDVGYHLFAESGPGGSGGGEILLSHLWEDMPPQMVGSVVPYPGYVFTGWTGQDAALGCILPSPASPEIAFDFWRYFVTLGQTKQVHLLATFAPENTPADVEDAVSIETPDGVVTIQFDAVVESGHTEVSVSSSGPTPPAGFRMSEPPVYYDITTTAQYNGDILICIPYDPDVFESDPESLVLFHYENGAWVDCTTYIDVEKHIVCGEVSSLSPFAICEPAIIPVDIAIKPGEGNGPAPINPKSRGTIPVAILGSADLDVAEVDPLTLRLNDMAVRVLPNGRIQCSIEDVNGDGYPDLVCQFVNNPLAWPDGTTTATLTGCLYDGAAIEGAAEIRLVP